ncbi:MAG: NADPH:quinone oxidoreductase family protein [Chloroflexota bacterium]|nr:NADPH:quinone oxidoreductase family protein [Chloroflexota bacterium]
MKAVLCKSFGAPDQLTVEEVPSPPVKAGEVKIRVRACGVNFPDALMIQGLYQLKPPFPFSPGLEVAGDIIEVGSGVDAERVGQRIMATMMFGGFAEEVVVPQSSALPMPENMSYESGAGFPLVYGTAHVALSRRARLQAGETLLVLGAAGGVGLAAVEIGKLMKARVIAAASSAEKLALARSRGADETINYHNENLRERIKSLSGDRGADVIFDPVGGDMFDQAVRRIAWEGRYLAIGFASGRIPSLPVNIALLKNASVVGLFWGAYLTRDPGVIKRSFGQLLTWYSEDCLRPYIHRSYALEDAPKALEDLINRGTMGKLVLTV